MDEPHRQSAAALGALLSEALTAQPQGTRALLAKLWAARDPVLRRLALDHVARMRWFADPETPERDLVSAMAADDDTVVVGHAVLAALRLLGPCASR